MSATLKILNNFEITAQGVTYAGKQGAAADDVAEAYEASVTGLVHELVGQLATAAVETVYESDDPPASFAYAFAWADQTFYVQVIGSGSNAIFKVAAYQPFVIPGFGKVLGAASTTAITGGSEPAVTDVASVLLGNYSGNTMNYVFAAIK